MALITVPQLLAAKLEFLVWHKQDGFYVEIGEKLADIRLEDSPAMVDCIIEIPSPATGKLKTIVGYGDIVMPGQQLGTIS